jgi:hypothetical protein
MEPSWYVVTAGLGPLAPLSPVLERCIRTYAALIVVLPFKPPKPSTVASRSALIHKVGDLFVEVLADRLGEFVITTTAGKQLCEPVDGNTWDIQPYNAVTLFSMKRMETSC